MAKRQKTTLTILPKNPRNNKRVPKPKVPTKIADPLSRAGVKAQVPLQRPGSGIG